MLHDLNDEQKSAVTHAGNVLLTACPGSGKTRVIINKLAYEVSMLDDLSRKRCVAVTFTVRASDEIFRRLTAMGIDERAVWSGTLHSFCLEWIVRPYSCYIHDLSGGFSIADEAFCTTLINDLRDEFGLDRFAEISTRLTRDGNYASRNIQHRKLLERYRQVLQEKQLIDFDLLLYYSYQILLTHEAIPRTLSGLFNLICVDEYQDTQDLLYGIICQIVRVGQGRTSLFMVGDTDQAIYTSLGGVAKTIEEIKFELGGLEITHMTLTGNYRSCQRVIDFYSKFQTQPTLIEARGIYAGENGLITYDANTDRADLVTEITRLIKFHLDRGVPEGEICVLVPQWWLIRDIARQLRHALPDNNFDASGMTPISRSRENIWYKLSRLILTEPSPRLSNARQRWAAELIDRFQMATAENFPSTFLSPRGLLRLINSIRSEEGDGLAYLTDCFDQFILGTGLDLTSYPQLIADRKIFLDRLRPQEEGENFPLDVHSLKRFYKDMTGIVINTCIGVKGEEFETVIAFGMLRGYIPHWQQIFDQEIDDITAAKKLLYVVSSRAKLNLHLIAEQGRKTRNGVVQIPTPALAGIEFAYDNV